MDYRHTFLGSIVFFSFLFTIASAQPRRSLDTNDTLPLLAAELGDIASISSGNASIAIVENADAFVLALLDPNTTTIRVQYDVVFNTSKCRDQLQQAVGDDAVVNLTRSVMVVGTSNLPLLDFSKMPRFIRLSKGITIEFRTLRLRGLYLNLDDAPIIFTDDSVGTVRFNNVYSQRNACLTPQLQLEKEKNAAMSALSSGTPDEPAPSPPSEQAPPGLPSYKPLAPPSPPSIDDSAIMYDSAVCFNDLLSTDPLGTDECYDTALLLQDFTITVYALEHPQGSDVSPSSQGLQLSFNMTILLCDVFVRPPCSQQAGEALAACIQELLDRRNSRPPSPPPAPPGSVWSPLPGTALPPPPPQQSSPPPSGRQGSAPPPLVGGQQSGSGAGGAPLLAVVLPSVIGGLVLLAALLVGFSWRRWGRPLPCMGRGPGGAGGGGGKLQEQDSDQVFQLQIHGGGKGSSPPPPHATHMRFLAKYGKRSSNVAGAAAAGSDGTYGSSSAACTTVSGSAAVSSSLTGLTGLTGCSPGNSANTDPTKGIALHHILGSGSFGRVYYGTWQAQGVAVKIIPHSETAHAKVQQEVALCIRFNHPHVVRSLHCATFEAAAGQGQGQEHNHLSQDEGLRTPSAAPGASGPGGGLSMETWIVLEYCNAGSLASHLGPKAAALGTVAGVVAAASAARLTDGTDPRVTQGQAHGEAATGGSGTLTAQQRQQQEEIDAVLAHMRGMLFIARDIAAGMAYLHSLNVCHGDLKCENVLLCRCLLADDAQGSKQQQQPQACSRCDSGSSGSGSGSSAADHRTTTGAEAGPSPRSLAAGAGGQGEIRPFIAKVADFGLSKTFSEASTHMSTATVGTVTHMCPVLLLTGQMRPSCDVFSFGIMLWQMATGGTPFANMRYAEIVYKVAVAGMRPEFPPHVPQRIAAMAEACWAADPTTRPTFEQLVVQLDELLGMADELQAEQEAALRAAREGAARAEDVAVGVVCSEDAVVVSQWAAAAAAALLE